MRREERVGSAVLGPEVRRTPVQGPLPRLISRERSQYLVHAAIAISGVALALVAYGSDSHAFSRLFGDSSPFPKLLPLVPLSFMSLTVLLSRGWFAVYTKETPKGLLLSAGLASALAAVAILLDFWIVYPETLNVPFPVSLAFYPSIAVFAEILLHLLPVTLLSILLAAVFRNADRGRTLWTAILLAALFEPALQMIFAASQSYPLWATFVTGFHVLVINVLMLSMLKRYGFVSVLSFRLFYYAIWHVVWGAVRLNVLF